jgi:hypothetical protein
MEMAKPVDRDLRARWGLFGDAPPCETARQIRLPSARRERNLWAMVEIEVYAAGLRAPEKMMGLALELEAIPGLRYKVDTNHDIVYMEFTDKVLDAEALQSLFRHISLEVKFVGQLPPEVSEKKKTQRLDIGEAP